MIKVEQLGKVVELVHVNVAVIEWRRVISRSRRRCGESWRDCLHGGSAESVSECPH